MKRRNTEIKKVTQITGMKSCFVCLRVDGRGQLFITITFPPPANKSESR